MMLRGPVELICHAGHDCLHDRANSQGGGSGEKEYSVAHRQSGAVIARIVIFGAEKQTANGEKCHLILQPAAQEPALICIPRYCARNSIGKRHCAKTRLSVTA